MIEKSGHDPAERRIVDSALVALLNCGYLEEALELADAAVAAAADSRDEGAFAEASQNRALVHFARGRTTLTMIDARNAIEGIDSGFLAGTPVPHGVLAACLVYRGHFAAADAVLQSAARLISRERDRTSPDFEALLPWYHLPRGCLLLALDQPAAALADFRTTGRLCEALPRHSTLLLPWRSFSARAEWRLGRRDVALRLLNSEVSVTRRFGSPGSTGRALRVLASIDPDADTLALLRESVELLSNTGMDLEHAYSRRALGRALAAEGDLERSREQLRIALDLAHRCGVAVLESSVRVDLSQAGARPRRWAATGVEALTASEQRVAALVVSGMSNRAIAEALFLSKNTIDWHLRNVYRKLGVRTRADLSHALDTPQP